jgi:flagellar biogenesis protein FliO
MNPLFLLLALAGAPNQDSAEGASPDALKAQLDALLATPREREPSPVARPIDDAPPVAERKPVGKALTLKQEGNPGILPSVGAGILVAAVGGALWLQKKKRKADGINLRVLESASLGRGRDLIVVQHANRRILLGVTDHGISVLRDDGTAPVLASLPPLPTTPAAIGEERAHVAPGVALFERELVQRLAGEAARREPLTEDDALRKKLASRTSSRVTRGGER